MNLTAIVFENILCFIMSMDVTVIVLGVFMYGLSRARKSVRNCPFPSYLWQYCLPVLLGSAVVANYFTAWNTPDGMWYRGWIGAIFGSLSGIIPGALLFSWWSLKLDPDK